MEDEGLLFESETNEEIQEESLENESESSEEMESESTEEFETESYETIDIDYQRFEEAVLQDDFTLDSDLNDLFLTDALLLFVVFILVVVFASREV